jgi:hypothetical protein
MKKTINILLIIVSLVLFQNCEDDQFETSLSYVTFGDSTYSTGVDVGGSNTIDVTVFSNKNVASDVTFNVVVDESSTAAAGSYNVPSSVTIPSGSNKGTFTIGLSDVNLGIGVNKLVLKFDDVDAAFASGNSTTVEYIQNCTEVTGTLDITFDRWGSEVDWEIRDSEGGLVVANSTAYGNTAGGTVTSDTINLTLCAGRNYTIELIDTYGDGWNGENVLTTPAYTLTIGGTVKATGDGDLGGTNGGSGPISITIPFDTL